MSSKKTSSKKVINLVAGVLLVAGFIILVACNLGHSKVFKLERGEAEALGVVFPEEGSPYESYFQLFEKYEDNREYEKAVVVAKKMIEVFPKKSGEYYEGYPYEKKDGYFALRSSYIESGKYEEAIEVDKKMWRLEPSITEREVFSRVLLLDEAGRYEEALKTLKKYRKLFSEKEADEFIKRAEQSVITGEKIFPESKTIK